MRDVFEFHISRRARDTYGFSEKLYEASEHVFHQSNEEVMRMIEQAAADYKIPVNPERVAITQTRTEIHIEVPYEVRIETPLIKKTLRFNAIADRKFSG